MDFFSQVWIGVRQELSVYKKEPKLLFSKATSFLIFLVITIAVGLTSNHSLESAAVVNAICQFGLYFTSATAIISKISSERANHFKEYLMINGMSKAAYNTKIAISNYVEIFSFSIIQTIALFFSYDKNFTTWTVIFPIFLVLFFGGIATVNMAFYLSTIFSPKNASQFGAVIVLFLGLLYFLPTEAINKLSLYVLVSFHPGAGIALGINVLLPADGTKIYWNGYNILIAIMILVVDSAGYLGLYLYKERRKEIKQSRKQKKKLDPLLDAKQAYDIERPPGHFSSTIFHEKLSGVSSQIKTIEALHIKKEYPGCVAVNDLSFSISEGELFCLLGHSGAGKTTLVNIIAGLIPKTEGALLYNGEEAHSDRTKGNIGFCPQKDFLMIENTVYENLCFFAGIQGIPSDQKDSEVNGVMDRLGLAALKDVPAKKLSSGSKRKLSVGIALMRDSKVIILDEPTSGMDPVSKKSLWSLIKYLKNENKTVIVTTKSLNEAKEVADQIAIITKGKFIAVGTLDSLNKEFNTGYKLVIENSDKTILDESKISDISDAIQSTIPTAIRDSSTTNNRLCFVLPVTEQSKFSEIFKQLENMSDIQVNLHLATLEEAFVNLAVNSEKASENMITKYQDHVDIPSSLLREKRPTFKDQLKAVLIARFYKMKRNRKLLIYSSLPLLFIIPGIVIGGHLNDKPAGLVFMIAMILFGKVIMIINISRSATTERTLKIMHTLKAMGVRTLPYWFGNIISDFIWILIMSVFVLASIYVFNVQLIKPIIVPFMGLYIGVSYGMIIMAYNLSLSFDNMFGILLAGPCFVIGGGFLPKMFSDFLRMQFGIQIDMYVYIFAFIFLGPGILLQLGLNLMLPEYGESSYILYAPFKEPWVYGLKAIGMSILHLIRLLYIDYTTFALHASKKYKEAVGDEVFITPIEKEVEIEKERVQAEENKDIIKAVDVIKVYPNGFKAVHDLSFGVEQGQIFCLVGPKGAGKTTALEILASMIAKAAGSIHLDGKELLRKIYEQLYSKNYYDIGVCSQTNSLWDYVTVEEHLRVYARMKGLRGVEIEEAAHYLLKVLQLEKFAQQMSQKLSEGEKRKLCVAMAMVGGAKLLFLDEPSTGMDNNARNCLWSVIKDVVKERQGAVVMSTNNMPEAILSDKFGILVNGKLTTVSSESNLKRQSEEYLVTICEKEDGLSTSEIGEFMSSIIPESQKQHTLIDRSLTFKVPSSLMNLSKLFSELQTMKSLEKIEDFSVSNNTSEQTFLQHIKYQKGLIEP